MPEWDGKKHKSVNVDKRPAGGRESLSSSLSADEEEEEAAASEQLAVLAGTFTFNVKTGSLWRIAVVVPAAVAASWIISRDNKKTAKEPPCNNAWAQWCSSS